VHKILWFFEGIVYWKTGKRPINGEFIKNNFGPTLKNLDIVLKELKDENKVKSEVDLSSSHYGYYQWLIKAVHCPEIKYLSSEEKDVLAFITTRFLNVSAITLSRATHTLYFERKNRERG